MPIWKSRQTKEMEREIAYRKSKRTLQKLINDSDRLRQLYWKKGRKAAELGDKRQLRHYAAGFGTLMNKIKQVERLLLSIEGIHLQRETARVSTEFIKSIQGLTKSMLESINPSAIGKMQANLQKALGRTEMLQEALGMAMETSSESIISGTGFPEEELIEITKAIEAEAVKDESGLDQKIKGGLQQIEEEMKKDLK